MLTPTFLYCCAKLFSEGPEYELSPSVLKRAGQLIVSLASKGGKCWFEGFSTV